MQSVASLLALAGMASTCLAGITVHCIRNRPQPYRLPPTSWHPQPPLEDLQPTPRHTAEESWPVIECTYEDIFGRPEPPYIAEFARLAEEAEGHSLVE